LDSLEISDNNNIDAKSLGNLIKAAGSTLKHLKIRNLVLFNRDKFDEMILALQKTQPQL
jgi:hypothetical protein